MNTAKQEPTLWALYVGSTSKCSSERRHDLISATFQRCSNIRCPLGKALWQIFSRFIKSCFLDNFHKYKMSMGLYNGKTRSSTLSLSWPTYSRRGIRVQKISESLYGVNNSDMNQIKTMSLHKRKSKPFETRFYWNYAYHKFT